MRLALITPRRCIKSSSTSSRSFRNCVPWRSLGPSTTRRLSLIVRNSLFYILQRLESEAGVKRFLLQRRYETLSVHYLMQDIKLSDVPWLESKSLPSTTKSHVCPTDAEKRKELFGELLYWLYDGLIIPLIRAHFYVTETGPGRNRIYYFRHDVWLRFSTPNLTQLSKSLFERIPEVILFRLGLNLTNKFNVRRTRYKRPSAQSLLGTRTFAFCQKKLGFVQLVTWSESNLKLWASNVCK